jgi:hypothetical protein
MFELMPATALRLFVEGLPAPWRFLFLLVPLVLVISLVYKATKVEDTAASLRQGVNLCAAILGVIALIAVGLTLLVQHL